MTKTVHQPSLEVRLQLAVLNCDWPPEKISATLGVSPTQTWKTGEPIVPGGTARHKQNGWAIVVRGDAANRDPDAALSEMIDRFAETNGFKKIPPSSEVQISIGLIGNRERPGLYLSAQTISRIASIGASIDLDTYDLTSA
jgi:Domain of unknown function (DUF4279)